MIGKLHAHSERLDHSTVFYRERVDRPAGRGTRFPRARTLENAAGLHDHDETDVKAATGLIGSKISRGHAQILSWVTRHVRAAQQVLGWQSDTFGIIHADLHQRNHLFAQGRVLAIDFDDCGFGHYLYDFAVALGEIVHLTDARQLRAAFPEGNRSRRGFPETHKAYDPLFIAYRDLHIAVWLLEQRDRGQLRQMWLQKSIQLFADSIERLLSIGAWTSSYSG